MEKQLSVDALLPAEMAQKAEAIGIKKAEMDAVATFVLAILAGAFIALGSIFATTVATGAAGMLSYGVTKLLVGLVFCLGLILVVVAGAELFTGNSLITMAWASGKVSLQALLRNWVIVYAGNFVGSVATALIMYFTEQYKFDGGAVGQTALSIASAKVDLGFVQAIALGMMCNALVCLAVWLTFSARSTIDKIAAIIFPITAFVAAGFEHSVANMYFIPIGLFIKAFDSSYTDGLGMNLSHLTWDRFLLNNLLPVTIGNIIGGAIMVAIVYWFIYLRPRESVE
ncbi:MAG: formate transporter FocA [Anaerolineae bacterium]|nr:formate transporter FocA [Anaerolineae bacterium]